jgi:hypothetical protein
VFEYCDHHGGNRLFGLCAHRAAVRRADLIGGTARIAWQNFRPFAELERTRAGTQKSWEWFEWLVEQLERHNVTKTSLEMGAPTVYRDWQP